MVHTAHTRGYSDMYLRNKGVKPPTYQVYDAVQGIDDVGRGETLDPRVSLTTSTGARYSARSMWARWRKGLLTRAVAALLAVMVSGAAFDWGHIGGDDPDCDGFLVAHDHSAHRFSAAPLGSSSPSGDHCYICHSLRVLHVGLTARSERVALDVHSTQLRDTSVLAARRTFSVALSSRAPPAFRL